MRIANCECRIENCSAGQSVHCCNQNTPLGTDYVGGSGRTGANSDGTATPMNSVRLSPVTLSQNLCSVFCGNEIFCMLALAR